LLKRVIETIIRYNMFEPGQRIGVAVSGGADSMCLFHILRELAPKWALKLTVLHLDHCLRGEESRNDAEFVQQMAAEVGIPVIVSQVDVPAILAKEGGNLEATARQVRKDFLLSFVRSGAVDKVAVGHTRSDQAETVLFRLLRGSGTTGIAGIPPVSHDGLVRPLLEVGRQEVEKFLRERSIKWREDSTNRDLSLARNRIRHKLLPALAREWNPAIEQVLTRMALVARDEEQYWAEQMDRLASEQLLRRDEGVFVQASVIRQLPAAVARRLIRRVFETIRGDLRRVDFRHTEEVLWLAQNSHGHGRVQTPGVEVLRSYDWIRFSLLSDLKAEFPHYRLPLTVPGQVTIPGQRTLLRLELIEHTGQQESRASGSRYNEREGELDWSRLPTPLVLRNWRPGDRYRPVGHAAVEKVKSLFQRSKVPLWERQSWPVLTGGGEILWTRRFGAAVKYAAAPDAEVVMRIREVENFTGRRNRTEAV